MHGVQFFPETALHRVTLFLAGRGTSNCHNTYLDSAPSAALVRFSDQPSVDFAARSYAPTQWLPRNGEVPRRFLAMMKTPSKTDRDSSTVNRFACLAIVAVAVALAGCNSKEAGGPSQVVANVNGEEITELQVNQALERQENLKPDQLESLSRKVVAALVQQEIVLRKAREVKIDREQRVVQNVEALKRDAVSRAYLERIAEGAARPSPKDVQTYFEGNPALFTQRKIYTFQEISVQVAEAQKAEIETLISTLKSPTELEGFLKTKQIPARSERTTAAAENLPLPLLQRISVLKPGQGLILPAIGGLRVVLLLNAQESPTTEEQARPAIATYLMNQNKRKAVEMELVSLRTATKVEYFGKYADLAASAVSAGLAASAPVQR